MDLAGASGPGINSIHTHTHTHKCTDTRTHIACTWVSCGIAADNVETPPSQNLNSKITRCELYSKDTHTQTHTLLLRSQSIRTEPLDQCMNRCVPTSELPLSADISSCTYTCAVCVSLKPRCSWGKTRVTYSRHLTTFMCLWENQWLWYNPLWSEQTEVSCACGHAAGSVRLTQQWCIQ